MTDPTKPPFDEKDVLWRWTPTEKWPYAPDELVVTKDQRVASGVLVWVRCKEMYVWVRCKEMYGMGYHAESHIIAELLRQLAEAQKGNLKERTTHEDHREPAHHRRIEG